LGGAAQLLSLGGNVCKMKTTARAFCFATTCLICLSAFFSGCATNPFHDYDSSFQSSIKQSWYAVINDQKLAGRKGKVILQFNLNYDGQITDMKVLKDTAGIELAQACQKAVLARAPYQHWPEDMIRSVGANYRTIIFTFYYY
jgi:hypothetical protein